MSHEERIEEIVRILVRKKEDDVRNKPLLGEWTREAVRLCQELNLPMKHVPQILKAVADREQKALDD